MNIIHYFILLVFGISMLNCAVQPQVQPAAVDELQVIPKPNHIEYHKGAFILNEDVTLRADAAFKEAAQFFVRFIQEATGQQLKYEETSIGSKAQGSIEIIVDKTIQHPEGYSLRITKDKITIRASAVPGAFYAVQTIRQVLPATLETASNSELKYSIPALYIEDAPRFAYRGMHLDVGRHFFSVDFIKEYIDMLALLKMNTFHWHLTEDQGWRVEINKYPRLNQIASYRKETLIGHYDVTPQRFDGKPYGGYYTQEEIRAVVAYAQERQVTIIPEIEMPGHSRAVIAAYPNLGCTGDTIDVATKWGVFEDIYCTKDESFAFIEDVLDEVLELFPSRYIHIGGDEAPKARWKACAACQQRIQDEGLADEAALQSYFIERIERYLNKRGRQIIGWDEILEGGLAPNATVMSWRGVNGALEAAKQGHQVIMTPTSHCYFDYLQSESKDEPTAFGGYLPLEKVYSFEPIPPGLTEEESKYVMGAQGNVWTEYMPTEEQVEYMVYPRILAMSEVLWSSKAQRKDYKAFTHRVEHFHKRLEQLDINYANHLYALQGEVIHLEQGAAYQLEAYSKGKTIRYTTNGTRPDKASTIYTAAIPIQYNMQLQAQLFDKNKAIGPIWKEQIQYHKAVNASIKIDKTASSLYPGSGAQGLINGVLGHDRRFDDKEWMGYYAKDIAIEIDLKDKTALQALKTRFHNGRGQWIYAPKYVEISLDDAPYQRVNVEELEQHVIPLHIDLKGKFVKRIRLKIPTFGIIPEGANGAGHGSWTFIDEIVVE